MNYENFTDSAAIWHERFAHYEPTSSRGEAAVDVIIPVYKGLAETVECLHSVLTANDPTPHEIVVFNDDSPIPELSQLLAWLGKRGLITLISSQDNIGYVQACNRCMTIHEDRDVVLLNSDTKVYNDWLTRLKRAAYSDPKIATVTPLTTNGEICSYPVFGANNPRPLEISYARLDQLASEVNSERSVEAPTGVGFCMYIKRVCLNEIGLFDEEAFGKGYGEENDLCLRAAAARWRHSIAADVFVVHVGSTSFGSQTRQRIKLALRTINEKYPHYLPTVDEFIRKDPVGEVRERLDLARAHINSTGAAILYVLHNWGGGTERHVQDLADRWEKEGNTAYFLRPDIQDPRSLRLSGRLLDDKPNLRAFRPEPTTLAQAMRLLGISHSHVHNLAGFPDGTVDCLLAAFRLAKAQYDVTIHDYACICPRIHLVDDSGLYCGEPHDIQSCEHCISRSGSPSGFPRVWQWREEHRRLLQCARRRFVPSEDVAVRLARYFPQLEFVTRPHMESPGAPRPASNPRQHRGPFEKVLVIGALGIPKGSILLRDVARIIRDRNYPIQFKLIGYSDRDSELRAANVCVTGKYHDNDLPELLMRESADTCFFPAVWPETFSYTLSEALKLGLFPIAFDIGAIAARLRSIGWGHLLPFELMLDPQAVARELAAVVLNRREEGHPTYREFEYSNLAKAYYEFDSSAEIEVPPRFVKAGTRAASD